MSVTIKKIAEIAGVSKSTVERALNNGKGVNLQTQQKVIAVAKALGYKTNIAGKLLSQNGKKKRIGILIPTSNLGREVSAGMQEAEKEFAEFGVEFLECPIEDDKVDTILDALSMAQEERWDAVVVRPIGSELIAQKLLELEQESISVITYNTTIANIHNAGFVGQDCYQAGKVAASLMQGLLQQHGDLLLVNGWKRWEAEQQRAEGFVDQMKAFDKIHIVKTLHMDDMAGPDVWDTLTHTVCDCLERWPEIQGIYSTEGSASCLFAICNAVARSGLEGKLKIIGHDSYPTNRKLLDHEKIAFLIDQQLYMQGYMAIKMAVYKIIHNMELPPWVKTSIQIVVKQNMSDINHTFKLF